MKRNKKSISDQKEKPVFKEIDYSKLKDDPFFVKKREMARKSLENVIWPKEILDRFK